MITVVTGQPGGGKSLFTLWHVKARAEKESRQVFYNGISDLTLPWEKLEDPKKWDECPPGSIIVLDECQRTFPTRSNGSHVPAHVSPLETHRHKGYDIYFITQHPSLLDNHVRKLAGRHFHIIRQLGMQRAKVYERQHVADQINNGTLKEASCTTFSYPKEAYSWYKSAEVHTHKVSIPRKYLLFPLLLAIGGGLMYSTSNTFDSLAGDEAKTAPKALPGAAPVSHSGMGTRAPMTKEEYLVAYSPRIPDLAHTAPVYDQVTAPDSAPYPQGCAQIGHRCRCYTQKGTKMVMSDKTCHSFLETGFFLSWADGPGSRKSTRHAQ